MIQTTLLTLCYKWTVLVTVTEHYYKKITDSDRWCECFLTVFLNILLKTCFMFFYLLIKDLCFKACKRATGCLYSCKRAKLPMLSNLYD